MLTVYFRLFNPRKIFLALVLVGIALFSLNASALASDMAQLETITFSQQATVTGQPFSLTMSTAIPGGVIRYTTNGSPPDPNTPAYNGPISIAKNTVIRAQVFNSQGQPVGDLHTKSYFVVDYEQTIPVMSLVSDWGNFNLLIDNAAERGPEWERPVNVEYFLPGGEEAFNVKAGVRIHGNFSRLFNPKKSFRLYFDKRFGGPGKLNYPIFEDTPVTEFDKLVLRAGFQDTFLHRGIPERADRHLTAKYISDQVVRNLHRDMGQPIAHGNWTLLYLNGEFWGLYNLTERIDLQMLQSYSHESLNPEEQINPEAPPDWDIIVKESGWDEGVWYSREEVRDGAYGGWLDNQNWIGSADFSIPGNIGGLEWRVDFENVFSYMFLQAYVQNTDWPGANWVVYQRKDPGAVGNERKWRMMVWDTEDSFGGGEGGRVDLNTIERTYSPHDSITRILEKPFIHNCGLKVQFWQRGREYLGVDNPNNKPETEVGQLSKERVKAEITKQADIVRPFIPMEAQRWAPDLDGLAIFENNLQQMLAFVDVREEIVLHHLDVMRYQSFTSCK
ncbi:MAG TPA: CotH kinase family protein [Anaerolineae bacterium]|nr:CotH kinase family protein [Anaerolineae bacterium]HMR63185.1 CotH kinase family protein [Anaerolineae bacterium]